MNKKFVAVTGIGSMLILTMCSSIALGDEFQTPQNSPGYTIPIKDIFLVTDTKSATKMEYDAYIYERKQEQKRLKNKELNQNLSDLKVAINNTIKYVDKTWYVFSGSTPEGWDCSGLVMWTYGHMGLNLYHSATAQMEFGEIVDEPKYGDIVGFKYHGSDKFYHVGIYISDDLMIHSGGSRGDKTELRSISNFGGDYSKIFYSRLIETN